MAGKKTGKRLLTWVLVLVMALSLLPLNALAEESQANVFNDAEEARVATGVKASKKRSEPDSKGNYTITLSVEGTTTTSETTNDLPADVVLVVDTSGSMAFCSQEEHTHDDACYAKCTRQNHPEHWVSLGLVWAHKVSGTDCKLTLDGYYYLTCTKTAHEHWAGKTWGDFTGNGCGNYEDDKRTEKETDDRRITHAIAAAKQFVGGLLTDGSKINVGLVDFSGSATASQALTQDKDQLNDAIGSLTTKNSTGTNYEAGLNAAKGILKGGSNKQQFIVFISDGEPEEDKDGKAAAEALKDSGVTIMTVGIALSDNEASDLKAISSTDSKGNVLYYATSATGLSSILATLRQTITDFIPAGRNAVMTDIINTDYFELVSKDSALDENDGTLTWRIGDIDKDKQEVSFKVKLKDGVQKVGELYTNNDVSLTFKSSKLENEEVAFTKDAIGTPFVEIYSVTYTDGVDDAVVFDDQTTYGLPKGANTPGFSGGTPTRKDYTFDGWSPEVVATVGGDTYEIVYTAQWEEIQKYTVTYELTDDVKPSNYSVPTDNKEYTKDEKYTVDSTYNKGSEVVEGGYTYTFSGWKLNGAGNVLTGNQTMGDGNVVLKGTWTKTPKEYTLSYETNGGKLESGKYTPAGQVEYKAQLTTPTEKEVSKSGYTLEGWYSDAGLTTSAPAIMPANDLTLYAKWTANSGTKYTVNHYQQNLNDNNYTLFETESDKTGTTGEQTNATAKNYKGFKAKPFEQKPIAADGSTVVEIRYDRNTYTVTYTDGVNNETIFEDEVHQGVKYGAVVPAYNNGTDPSRENYTFAGWDFAVPDTMPANDLTFTAKWEKNPVGDATFDFNDVFHDGKNTPAITKTVKGNVGKNFTEAFYVTVKGVDEKSTATMATASYTGKAKVTYSDLKNIAFQFAENDKLTFRDRGTYTYTVWETPGKPSRMSYDTTEYTLTIKVVLNKNTNKYEVESWQFTAGNREYPTPLNIVNTYRTYHPSTPSKPTLNTGDHYAYVMGYPDGTVRPNGSITRAEVSAILFRLLSDKTRDEYFTTESSFTDVKAGAWYNNSIATLEKAGVIVDTAKGGAFRPNEAITRAELAAMLAQFSDAKPVKGVKFSDVSAEHWAYEAIAIAAKMGWIEGYPDGTFRPDATITRAEMMTLVNRALERVPSDEDHLLSKRVMLTFPDCKSGDWFYIAVQEATNSHTYERAATEKNGDEQWTALRANRDWTQLEK